MKYGIAILLALFILPAQGALDWQAALNGDNRSAENKSRDGFRHLRESMLMYRRGMLVSMIRRGSPSPSTRTRKIGAPASPLERYATCLPSGDQRGAVWSPGPPASGVSFVPTTDLQ